MTFAFSGAWLPIYQLIKSVYWLVLYLINIIKLNSLSGLIQYDHKCIMWNFLYPASDRFHFETVHLLWFLIEKESILIVPYLTMHSPLEDNGWLYRNHLRNYRTIDYIRISVWCLFDAKPIWGSSIWQGRENKSYEYKIRL